MRIPRRCHVDITETERQREREREREEGEKSSFAPPEADGGTATGASG